MALRNIFKKKKSFKGSKDDQKILDNIMNFIDDQKEKNIKILENDSHNERARANIDFIRELYKFMNS